MKKDKITMYILGALITAGFFGLLGMLIFKGIPAENSDVLYLAIGALVGYQGAVVQYFYGSSAGSAEKSQQIAEMKTGKVNG